MKLADGGARRGRPEGEPVGPDGHRRASTRSRCPSRRWPRPTTAGSSSTSSGVDFLASIGIRAILQNARAHKLRGGGMALLAPPPLVEEVLRASGVANVVPIVPTSRRPAPRSPPEARVIDRTLEVEAKLDSVRAVGLWLEDGRFGGRAPVRGRVRPRPRRARGGGERGAPRLR